MRRHAIGALAFLVLASCATPRPTTPLVGPTTASSPAPAAATGTSPVEPTRPAPSNRSQLPTPSAEHDVGAQRDRFHGRCKVTPFWVSPDRARVAECVSLDREPRSPEGHFSLAEYDVATDALIEQHVVGEGDALRAQTAVTRWLEYTPLLQYVSHAEQARTEREIRAIAPSRAEGEGLVVWYVAPTLTFADRRGTTLWRRAFPAWKRDDFGDDGCHAPEHLEGVLAQVWGDRDRGVFMVRLVGTSGFEGCGSVHHVITVPEIAAPALE